MENKGSQSYRNQILQNSYRTVPEAPGLNAIPDIDSFLSAGGDALFDINPSQYIKAKQNRQKNKRATSGEKRASDDVQEIWEKEKNPVTARGDGQTKKAKVYPVIHKVDPKVVSRNGKNSSSFVVPVKIPGQKRVSQQRSVYGSREDIFEESSNYFHHMSPAGDCLYTPAPLIVPVASQIGRMKLRSVSEITEKYRSIFDFPCFNIVQSKVFDDVMYTDKPLVLCSPTGSGKTAVFEMAIVRLMNRSAANINSIKIVYMAPIKALCSERFTDWKEKLEPLGLKCMELTGDTDLDDFYRLQEVQMILTTPEKWDSMTRKWRDNKGVMQAICLFLIDEIHILNDPSRGSTVEAVVTRMKTIQAARYRASDDTGLPPLRFVAVSATITNIEDVAEWLGNSRSRAVFYKMDDSARPVRLRKVVLGYYYAESKQSEFQFDLTLSYKLASVIKTYSEDKPTLVFCSTRKSAQQSAEILSKDMKSSFIKSAQHRQLLNNLSYHIKDAKLRDLVCKGIGFHHAGMDLQDRKSIEETFAAGNLPVLVSTSTLAMGVNLPAHLVIIKSTMFYNLGVYQEYSDTQVLQMIGRAGRPQFDKSATAVIMTKNQTKMKYENLLNGTQLIESSLHKNLIEHLNAEIVLHTISDISVAVEWLKYTFLYIRVFKNPKHYGLPIGLSRDSIEKRLQDMCMKDLKQLNSLEMISMDEENLEVKPQESGKLMARYCISFKTMQLFTEIKGAETVAELVALVSKCQEFTDIQLRTNEKKTLNTLNRDKNRITIRYPVQGKIKTADMKVNCLIQTAFGSLLLQDFALQQDTSRIFRAGIRVTRCLVEILWQKQDFKALLSALQLCKCFRAKLWEDSKFVSKQLDGIGPALSNALVNAGITTFEKIEEMNPREIELIVNRHPPFGNQVRESVSSLPKYELVIEQMTRYAVNTSEIVITIQLSNRDMLRDKAMTNHTSTLLIGDQDNGVVYKQRIMDAKLLKEGSWSKKLDIKHAAKGPDLFIHYISQEWVGLDVECTFTPNYLGGRRITSTTTSYSPKTRGSLSNLSSSNNEKVENYIPCNHQCHNKQTCAHECCKTGVSARKRQQRSHDTGGRSCGRGIQNHISEIQSRVSNMPLTPGQMKKPRLEFKTTSNVAGPSTDLSKYSYTPRKFVNNNTTDGLSQDCQPEEYIIPDNEAEVDETDLTVDKTGGGTDWAELDIFQKQREQSYTGDEEQNCQEGGQNSLPDLVFNSPEPGYSRESDCIWEKEQQNYGDDDFAQETEYGYHFVQREDMNKLPADWDDHVTELTEVRNFHPKSSLKNRKQSNTLLRNIPTKRKPLFQRRSSAVEHQENYMQETVNPDTDAEVEIIDYFDSEEEKTASRWTDFVDSQSSEDTDCLSKPFPAKLENRPKVNQCYSDVKQKSDIRLGVPSNFWNDQSQILSCPRVSLKPQFLARNSDGGIDNIERKYTQNIQNGGTLQSRNILVENKENLNWQAGRHQSRYLSKGRSEWSQCDERADLEAGSSGTRQNHKFGQVLAWVSNSQNKTESRSESDWDDWSDETEALINAEQNEKLVQENASQTNQSCPKGKTSELNLVEQPVTATEKCEKPGIMIKLTEQKKQHGFSSFFSKNQPKDQVDSFSNIFDGLF